MVHGILFIQLTCLTVLSTTSFQVLFGLPLGLEGRGTLGILLFIAGRGRKAYWKRGGWRGGANTLAGCMLLARTATNHIG